MCFNCTAANTLCTSHRQGYSSLRFRPIRHLSSPVEDLEMCKVIGVTDKVRLTFFVFCSPYEWGLCALKLLVENNHIKSNHSSWLYGM